MDISDEQIKQYWADGATVLRDVISPEWRERLAAAIENKRLSAQSFSVLS